MSILADIKQLKWVYKKHAGDASNQTMVAAVSGQEIHVYSVIIGSNADDNVGTQITFKSTSGTLIEYTASMGPPAQHWTFIRVPAGEALQYDIDQEGAGDDASLAVGYALAPASIGPKKS